MEKIGFKVPEVAKNMSMQEAKLLDIADQLGRCEQLGFQGHSFTGCWDIISRQFYSRMLDHYHEVVGSVEGAELELLLEDLKATEVWKKISLKKVESNFQPSIAGGTAARFHQVDLELSGHLGLHHTE